MEKEVIRVPRADREGKADDRVVPKKGKKGHDSTKANSALRRSRMDGAWQRRPIIRQWLFLSAGRDTRIKRRVGAVAVAVVVYVVVVVVVVAAVAVVMVVRRTRDGKRG